MTESKKYSSPYLKYGVDVAGTISDCRGGAGPLPTVRIEKLVGVMEDVLDTVLGEG